MNPSVFCLTISCMMNFYGSGPTWTSGDYIYASTPKGVVACRNRGAQQPCTGPGSSSAPATRYPQFLN